MSKPLCLLPRPQEVSLTGGEFALPQRGLIALDVPRPAESFFTARQLQRALEDHGGVSWAIAGGHVKAPLRITRDPAGTRPEGYRLVIDSGGITLAGHDAAGVFYGAMTLAQLIQTHSNTLPTLVIEDWPDFAARGVMLDISRDKVPTMETLFALVDRLASWKINQFQLYTEHTFAYQNHSAVWEHASPLTAEEILALDAYCRERFVELVPNQNSFGHMHRWFEHARYLPLAEVTEPFTAPWGSTLPPFSLSPAVPEALDLIDELYAELLPNFTSRLFNVGCDETFDLGLGRSKSLVAQQGKGRVYLDFLLDIHRRVQAHGRTMQFWGDVINQYPDLVPEVPKDTIALEWGYEANHDFPGKTRLFAASGVPFYVCPGTSSWNSIAGRTDNCLGNIHGAVENGLAHGAIGVLNTDWGDNGHWQTLPISYLGYAVGAALSWAYQANADLDIPAALDAFAFQDSAGVMGKLAYDLGNVYQVPGILRPNRSILDLFYRVSLPKMRGERLLAHLPADQQAILGDDDALSARLRATLDTIDAIMAPLERARMAAPDADLIKREFGLAADMLRHGARRALAQIAGSGIAWEDVIRELATLEQTFRAVWLERNRPGGLDDSAARLVRVKREK